MPTLLFIRYFPLTAVLAKFPNWRLAAGYAAFLLVAWRFCGMTNVACVVALAATYVLLFRRWPGMDETESAHSWSPFAPRKNVLSPSERRHSPFGDYASLPWLRWTMLTALLACEAVAFALRFNVASLGPRPGGWLALVAGFPNGSRTAAAVVLATLLFAGRRIMTALVRGRCGSGAGRVSFLTRLASHIVLMATFAWLTAQILDHGRDMADAEAARWVLAWTATGAGGLVSWVLCLLPVGLWRAAAAPAWRVLAVVAAARIGFGYLIPASQSLWTSLASVTLWCVKTLLALVYADVVCRPEEFIVGTPSFHVFVAPRCSGYEGIALISVFLLVYFWFDRRALRFPHVLVLLPLGAGLAFAANSVRLAALVAVGTSWSEEVAMGGFHSQAGWLALNGVALGLVGAAGRLRWFAVGPHVALAGRRSLEDGLPRPSRLEIDDTTAWEGHPPYLSRPPEAHVGQPPPAVLSAGAAEADTAQAGALHVGQPPSAVFLAGAAQSNTAQAGRLCYERDDVTTNPVAPYLMPFLAIVATSMVTGAFSAGFDWLYGLRVIAAAALLAYFWPAYSALRWSWSWQPVALGTAAFGLWLVLTPGTDGTSGLPDPLRSASSTWAGLWLVLRTLGYLVTAPLAEELAFRGFLMRRFVSADFERVPLGMFHWLGFAGSSLLFGLMHGQAWLAALVAGMLFAWAALRRGNLADAVVAHATTNGLNLIYVLASGDWGRLG